MRAPFAPPRLSVPRNVDAEAQAVVTSCEMDSPEARILSLSSRPVNTPNPAFTYTVLGLQNGETVGSVTLTSTGTPATAGVGGYAKPMPPSWLARQAVDQMAALVHDHDEPALGAEEADGVILGQLARPDAADAPAAVSAMVHRRSV